MEGYLTTLNVVHKHYRTAFQKFINASGLVLLLLYPSFSYSPTQEEITLGQRDLKKSVVQSGFGAQYAHLLNFVIESNISSSTLRIGGDDGYDVKVFKFPIKYETEVDNQDWTAITLANISIGELKFSNTVDLDNRIDGTLTAYSASLGAGIRVPLSDTISSLMLLEFSLSQLTNKASYIGQDAIENRAPIYDGILYNWSTNA